MFAFPRWVKFWPCEAGWSFARAPGYLLGISLMPRDHTHAGRSALPKHSPHLDTAAGLCLPWCIQVLLGYTP